jgi:predicted Zn-dependent protease
MRTALSSAQGLREFPHISILRLQPNRRVPRFLLIAALWMICSARPWAQLPSDVGDDAGQGQSPITTTTGQGEIPPSATTEKLKTGGKYDVNRIGQRKIGNGVNLYSLEKERVLGHELAQEIESRSRLIGDPRVTEYVNRIGQSIVRNSDARVPFMIKVVDDDEINAFALPGGFFYVNSGLILAAESEAELAGAMAHEIAHVAARHATRNATRAQIFNLASIPLIFVGGPVGYAVRQVAGLAVPMSFLKFSRDAEREADLLGIEYEYAAGYDPQSFVQFFERLQAKEKEKHNFIGKAFTTHPMNEDRIKRAQKEIATMLPAKEQYVVDTSEFEEVKARLADVVHEHHPEGGRPTLRKRASEDKSDSGPVLRRNTGR